MGVEGRCEGWAGSPSGESAWYGPSCCKDPGGGGGCGVGLGWESLIREQVTVIPARLSLNGLTV